MTGQRTAFADWENKAVAVTSPGHDKEELGVLEEVNDSGVVLQFGRWITVRPEKRGNAGDYTSPNDFRHVSEFRPWHMIASIRMLERWSGRRRSYAISSPLKVLELTTYGRRLTR